MWKSKACKPTAKRYITENRLVYLTLCRKRSGFTQEETSELFGVNRSLIIGFETGRNERTDLFFKYVFNFVPVEERKTIIEEYINANLK